MNARIKQIQRNITRVFERDPTKTSTHPYRDWLVMLCVSFVLVVAIASVHYYVFVQINASEIFQTDTSTEANERSLERTHLENVLNKYQEKQAQFELLREQGPQDVDPS